MRAAKAMASLCICTDSPEPSLLADPISTKISCNGPFIGTFLPSLESSGPSCYLLFICFVSRININYEKV